MNIHDILVRPVMTEAAMAAIVKSNRYTFVVNRAASKPQIKNAIEQIFSVHVTKVHTVIMKGGTKKVVRSRVSKVKQPDWKKATVQVKPGESISLFDVAESKEDKKKAKKEKKAK